jgi:hypothetical protein
MTAGSHHEEEQAGQERESAAELGILLGDAPGVS